MSTILPSNNNHAPIYQTKNFQKHPENITYYSESDLDIFCFMSIFRDAFFCFTWLGTGLASFLACHLYHGLELIKTCNQTPHVHNTTV